MNIENLALSSGEKSENRIKVGLIGKNIQRSRFSAALDILCKSDGFTLEFELFDSSRIAGFKIENQIADLRNLGNSGITITHPFKTVADELADQREGYPAKLGASNLLRFDSDKLIAFNTDYSGFKAAWAEAFGAAKPGKVAMAGAGGVARALAQALIDLGADSLQVWDQNEDAAQALAKGLDPDGKVIHAVPAGSAMTTAALANGAVNATPMGMAEHPGSAFPEGAIGMQDWAFDAVYTPKDTHFLKLAARAGVETISGFELFRHMAVRSYAHYARRPVNPEHLSLLSPLAEGL